LKAKEENILATRNFFLKKRQPPKIGGPVRWKSSKFEHTDMPEVYPGSTTYSWLPRT